MNVHAKMLLDTYGVKHIVLYETSCFDKPLCVLAQHEAFFLIESLNKLNIDKEFRVRKIKLKEE